LEHARTSYAELDQQLATRSFEPAAQAELSAVDQQLALLGTQAELERARRTLDERISGLEAQLSEQARLEATLESRHRDLSAAGEAALALEQLEVTLHALELRLESGDFAHAIRQRGRAVEAAIAELGYSDSARELTATALRDLLHWEQEERELLLADVRLSDARRRQEQGEELQQRDVATHEQLSQEVTLLEHELRDLPRVQARVAELQSALGEARRRLEVARNDRAEKSAHVSRAEYAAQEVERHRGEERRLMERQSLFTELAEAFGRKGVQAMLIETAIPQIEDEANRILGRMTDGQMHVSFEMQRDSKKGETIETLEIRIADTIGTRIYDAFSGGEAMRVNFAIRIALSRLLARRAGARLETLVIDEGFGTLDGLGRERMVEAITSVQGDFRRIVVITHIEELKDRFPVQIEIIKSAAGSRWELR
jgi:exonuclease SbcC